MIKIKRDEKEKFIKDIQEFFYSERDEEIGIIAAEQVLEFFMEDMAKLVYNRALDDAKIWRMKRDEELELDFELLYKDIK